MRAGALFTRDWVRWAIPVWRFFETPEATPQLYYRLLSGEVNDATWRPVIDVPTPRWWRMFWNPAGNLALLRFSLLDQLVQQLEELGPIELEQVQELLLFRLLCNSVELRLSAGSRAAACAYQLRITRSDGVGEEELLVSDVRNCAALNSEARPCS